MHIGFEEKMFEHPTTFELLYGSPYFATPGQVLESQLGFDVAMMTQNAVFWNLWGIPPATGAIPTPTVWPHSKSRPPFALNLFLQYKRPDVMTRSTATEWTRWKKTYYRFDTTPHQQRLLEHCASGLGANGLVLYGAPAYRGIHSLYKHQVSSTLVANTAFVESPRLARHSRWTYRDAGKVGQAHSEPTDINMFVFERDLESRLTAAGLTELSPFESLRRMLTHLRKSGRQKRLMQIIENSPLREQVIADLPELPPTAALDIELFCDITLLSWLANLTWLVAGRAHK